MAETAQERTEKPTPRRYEKARRDGQVPRSMELNAASVVGVTGAVLYALGSWPASGLSAVMKSSLALTREQAMDETLAVGLLAGSMRDALLAFAPVLGLTLLAALFAPLLIGGWNLTFKSLVLDPKRLSPVAGIKRIFSVRSLVELCKAFAKFLVVASIAAGLLYFKADELMGLGAEPTVPAIAHAVSLTGTALIALAGGLALIALVDVPWQLRQHSRNLRMTRQEIREELKETEGPPEVRSRIRETQQALARRRMMQEVPKADVVVTNPAHYAVALRYDEKRMRAPVVVAKGVNEVALRIREVARASQVPLFEAPPLARVLYRHVDIGMPIPSALYVAVAQVLTYIYQLKSARRHGFAPPAAPEIDPGVETALDVHPHLTRTEAPDHG